MRVALTKNFVCCDLKPVVSRLQPVVRSGDGRSQRARTRIQLREHELELEWQQRQLQPELMGGLRRR